MGLKVPGQVKGSRIRGFGLQLGDKGSCLSGFGHRDLGIWVNSYGVWGLLVGEPRLVKSDVQDLAHTHLASGPYGSLLNL